MRRVRGGEGQIGSTLQPYPRVAGLKGRRESGTDRRGEPQASSFEPPYAEIRKDRLSPIPKRGLGREVKTDEYE